MTDYRMFGYELGTYMEIYLPKKAIYQPFLFKLLTRGFKIEKVRKHFLSKKQRPRIVKLLGKYKVWADYDKEYIENLRPFFYGYSMYEVDGVFKAEDGSGRAIDEERTQVIRLIFRLEPLAIAKEAGVEDMEPLEIRSLISDYLRAHNREKVFNESSGDNRKIIEKTKEWRDQLGFFVFGYIIFGLCKHIEKLSDDDQIKDPEKEIWVTNFANMELDRIIYSKQKDGK